MKKLTPSKEHYIKTIYSLFSGGAGARISDIAEKLAVSKASATYNESHSLFWTAKYIFIHFVAFSCFICMYTFIIRRYYVYSSFCKV